MYKEMDSKELLELFNKYASSNNYKERVEASKIVSYLGEIDIKNILQKIIYLNNDQNIAVSLSLLNSLKLVFSKYPNITKYLLVYIYINAQFSNNIIKEVSEQIIESLDPKIIDNIVVKNTSNLYSKNGLEAMRSLLSLGFISLSSPEYLKNSLLELSMISINSKYKLLKVVSQGIIDGFENIDRSILKDLKFLLEDLNCEYTVLDVNSFNNLAVFSLKNKINKEDAIKLLNNLKSPDKKIRFISAITLKENSKILVEILNNDIELSKYYCLEIIKNIEELSKEDIYDAVLLSSYSKIISIFNVDTSKASKIIKNNIITSLTFKNYITSYYCLESLYFFSLMGKNELNLRIKEVMNSKDVKALMKYNSICYYTTINVLCSIGEYDNFKVELNPYFNEELIKDFLNLDEGIRYSQFKDFEKYLKSKDWFERYNYGIKIGNLLYVIPKNTNFTYNVIKKLLNDKSYLVRTVGIWALLIILDRRSDISKKIILEILPNFDDFHFEVRILYSIFYNKLIKKYPEILENYELQNKLKKELITKYITDKFQTVRKISKNTLEKFPDSKYLLDYEKNSIDERYQILKKAVSEQGMTKPAILRLKLKLRHFISENDEENILKLLEFLKSNTVNEDYFYIFSDLKKIENKYPLAREIIDLMRNNFEKVPEIREKAIYSDLKELMIPRRIYRLKEVLSYISEGFTLNSKIMKVVNEFLIYPQADDKITELSMEILMHVKNSSAVRILAEKKELIEYLKSKKDELPKKIDVKTQNWKEIYSSLNYLITQDYRTDTYVKVNFSDFLRFNPLETKNSLIIGISMLYIMNSNLKEGDFELLDEINKNKFEVLKVISEMIYSEKDYPLLSHDAKRFLRTIMNTNQSWFTETILLSGEKEFYLPLISKLLDSKDISIQIQVLELLKEIIKLDFDCSSNLEIREKVLGLIKDDEKWIVFKKALEVLYICKLEENPKLLEEVGTKLIDYLKTAHDDSKLFLIKFFKIKGIGKISDELFEKLMMYKDSSNPYVSSELNELFEKRKGK
ncbi:hypothetical protein Mevan_0955 [Methanococcus vannielii SB]|uniref:Uncharacterized protein n=1 Tax=Methanococcus vannielii (strain ATCC 35089 / DSM 1224 / JCM 13029 / OCM 148 / SB) TaxID=406327 RepID=A6UQT6_METVS|nr:hypothetical protein [Methanococcus vannielii]ABR54858.1 hypothetical protein Mevan_0955 [Methanococcus vannielii SB]